MAEETNTNSGGGFFDFLGGLADYATQPGVLLPGVLGGLLTGQAYGRLSDIGQEAVLGKTIDGVRLPGAMELAETALEQTQFRPFTVTTATGAGFGTQVDPVTGAVKTTMGLSPDELAMQRQLLGGASGFFTGAVEDPSVREEELYGQIRDATMADERMARLGLEERLAAQGRLGVKTAQFGGTPEQLAMERAQQQAMAQARLGAAQQARQEQMQQAQLGQQFLGAGYVPQQQLISTTAPSQYLAGLQQQAQLEGAGLFGETAMSGLEARLIAEQARANLLGQIGTGLLSGAFTPRQTSPTSVIGDFFRGIGGIGGSSGGGTSNPGGGGI
tara:strand:- start:306 stop:1295 length:990 start_codon:yes stop_codon:yes gene_type:complete